MLPLLWTAVGAVLTLSVSVHCTVYVTDHDQRMVLEMNNIAKPCIVHTERQKVNSIVKASSTKYLHRMPYKDLQVLKSSCRDSEQIKKRGGYIFPGTKWCGPGSIALNYNDLGPALVEEDKCCREHDHCPIQLEPGQCRGGLCNTTPFTRSHCDCDNAFKRCLREVNSDPGNLIANIYFNILQVTCFTKRRTCPHYMRGCKKMEFQAMTPYLNSRGFNQVESDILTGILQNFLNRVWSFME